MPPPSPFAKLRLETLESREVPASLTWIGADPGHFADSSNWYNRGTDSTGAVPTSSDDLYFVGLPTTRVPGVPTYLPINTWGLNPNSNATIPTELLALQSVHLLNGYDAHVAAYDNQQIGTLDLQTGNFDQLAASDGSNDLVITSCLSFIGGTLNSTTNTGTVHITGENGFGACANLQPLYTSSLTIGSTLSLEGLGSLGGAGMVQFCGNYNHTNGAGTIVGTNCVAFFAEPMPNSAFSGDVKISENGDGTFVIVKGTATCKNYSGQAHVEIQEDGVLTILSGSTVDLKTGTWIESILVKVNTSEGAGTGQLILEGDTTLTVAKGLKVQDAKLIVTPVKKGEAAQKNASIIGDVSLTGARSWLYLHGEDLFFANSITDPRSKHYFAALTVSGDMTIEGICFFGLNARDTGDASLLSCGGVVTFATTSRVQLRVYPRDAATTSGSAWAFVISPNALVGTLAKHESSPSNFSVLKVDVDKQLQAVRD